MCAGGEGGLNFMMIYNNDKTNRTVTLALLHKH